MNCAVLGLGSPHGDDQVGWILVDKLNAVVSLEVVCEKLSTPAHGLVNILPQYDRVIVIDACEMGKPAGEYVYHEDGSGFLHISNRQISSHALGLADSWQLLKKLQLPLPEISLLLIQIGQTEAMAPLSDGVEKQLPEMLDVLNEMVITVSKP